MAASDVKRVSAGSEEFGPTFREAMSQLAAAVVMVTTRIDGKPWGLTISACCSVSAEPPMLLISLFQHTASTARIREEGRFGVSVLGQDHEAAARAGAAPGKPKFVEQFCHDDDDPAGIPVLRGAIAHLECEVERAVDVADHTVFFGTVGEISMTPGKLPLLYYGRDYAALEQGEPWYS